MSKYTLPFPVAFGLTVLLFTYVTRISGAQKDAPWIDVFYPVVENLPPHSIVGNVGQDAGLASKYGPDLAGLSYSFLPQNSPYLELFALDETSGTLRTAGHLDRDTICSNGETICPLVIDVGVLGPGREFDFVKVTVTLIDLNDNGPEFAQDIYSITVSEAASPGVEFVLPTAKDPDSGVYDIQDYRIEPPSDTFTLKKSNNSEGTLDLRLVLKSDLDREYQDEYVFHLIASDGGNPPREGETVLSITIGDANDNSPIFDHDQYEITAHESYGVNLTVIRVHATDSDIGLNGEIVYTLASETANEYGELFGINEETGEIYLKKNLDFEEQDTYRLTVSAQDKGTDSIPTHAEVIIRVIDMNDFTPQITVNALTQTGAVEVPENGAPGDLVAHVRVEDKDSSAGGEVECELNDSHFVLEEFYTNMYRIKTTQTFDRELVSSYDVTIECIDHGNPPLSANHDVTIQISDENDHTPHFTLPRYSSTVSENNSIGSVLLTVNATDEDTGENARITYSILGDSVSEYVTIDPDRGRMTTAGILDYETLHDLAFTVVATDHGNPPHSATVPITISIQNRDDEPPTFTAPSYEFAVYEGEPPGTQIGTVSAIDPDSSYIDWSFDPKLSPIEIFRIDDRGTISLLQELDREGTERWSMVVVAKGADGPSSTVSVEVAVSDRNDNAPLIIFPTPENNTVHLPFGVPAGHVFTRIIARDADYGDNAKLEYRIDKGDQYSLFSIDSLSGIMTTRTAMRNLPTDSYLLYVSVQDRGNPPKTATTELHIVINKTLAAALMDEYPPLAQTSILNSNQTILIAMSVVTLILVFILIFAIVYVKRKQNKEDEQHYKCKIDLADQAAGEMQQSLTHNNTHNAPCGGGYNLNQSTGSISVHTKTSDLDTSRDTGGEGTDDERTGITYGSKQTIEPRLTHPQHSHDGSLSPRYTPQPVGPVEGGGGVQKQTNLPRHRLVDDPRVLAAKGWNSSERDMEMEATSQLVNETLDNVHRLLHMVLREPGGVDSDHESGCSADMSTTDSGRGPSEDGGDHNHHNHRTSSPPLPPPPPSTEAATLIDGNLTYPRRTESAYSRPPTRDPVNKSHVAYVTPQRHVRMSPSPLGSFKSPNVTQNCVGNSKPVSSHYHAPGTLRSYTPKRTIQFDTTPTKTLPPQRQYHGGGGRVGDGILKKHHNPVGESNCDCNGPCEHVRYAIKRPHEGDKSPSNGCELVTLQHGRVGPRMANANHINPDRPAVLDSVV